jgi:hypothetical protein
MPPDFLARCSRASEALILALSGQAGRRSGRSRSIRRAGLCLPIDFLTRPECRTCASAAATTCRPSSASRPASPARTSRRWAWLGTSAASSDSGATAARLSGRHYVSSASFAPLGWSWRTSRRCSLSALAATLRRSSVPSPTWGTWDAGGCWMARGSEFPRSVAAFSWSRVLDATPTPSSWLTPRQWRQYLARLCRSASHARQMPGLGILRRRTTRHASSISAVRFSSLRRGDGIRWLSGPERLAYMGFPSDWTRSIRRRAWRPATPSSPPSPSGSPGSSPAPKARRTRQEARSRAGG